MNRKGKKLKNVAYINLKIQPYLKTNKMFPNLAKSIFRFRTRMSNVKNNFKSKYSESDLNCPLTGCDEIEDDIHLSKCKIIDSQRSNIDANINYTDLFSRNIDKQIKVVKYLEEGEKIRDTMMEKQNQND